MASRLLAASRALAGALSVSACGPLSITEAAPAHGATGSARALAQLDALAVRERSPLAGYSREAFGASWSDAGTVELSGNSCPPRQDVLARDLDDVVRAEDGCRVLSGVLHDRYTGRTIDFQCGPRTSLAVQIDHVVPLELGWQPGAHDDGSQHTRSGETDE